MNDWSLTVSGDDTSFFFFFHYMDTFGGDLTRIDRFLGYNRGNRAFVARFFLFFFAGGGKFLMGFGEHQKMVRSMMILGSFRY